MEINRLWIERFLAATTRSRWIELNEVVNRFASHVREQNWREAAKALRNEVAIRKEITPEAFTPTIIRMIEESEKCGCGARFAGAGGGGTVWAVGEVYEIERLRETWTDILKDTENGRMLECALDPIGVRGEDGNV